jgi:aerobic-type carbon monoxide dehydrogenase small subunit (CoxS/CutS family)
MWLTVGCFQIYFTPPTSWKAHRIFGRVAVVVLVGHIVMMAVMTYENPVNQHLIILVGYVGMICNVISNLWQGIKYARMTVAARREEEEKNSGVICRCKKWVSTMFSSQSARREEEEKNSGVICRCKKWVSTMFSSKKQKSSETFAQLHKMCMFNVYVRSTMGSGSIRIAAWALLLVGHFLS